jgi:hypothetical protein
MVDLRSSKGRDPGDAGDIRAARWVAATTGGLPAFWITPRVASLPLDRRCLGLEVPTRPGGQSALHSGDEARRDPSPRRP